MMQCNLQTSNNNPQLVQRWHTIDLSELLSMQGRRQDSSLEGAKHDNFVLGGANQAKFL
jgi:hypothetical protein